MLESDVILQRTVQLVAFITAFERTTLQMKQNTNDQATNI
jgi:hypothetical protein